MSDTNFARLAHISDPSTWKLSNWVRPWSRPSAPRVTKDHNSTRLVSHGSGKSAFSGLWHILTDNNYKGSSTLVAEWLQNAVDAHSLATNDEFLRFLSELDWADSQLSNSSAKGLFNWADLGTPLKLWAQEASGSGTRRLFADAAGDETFSWAQLANLSSETIHSVLAEVVHELSNDSKERGAADLIRRLFQQLLISLKRRIESRASSSRVFRVESGTRELLMSFAIRVGNPPPGKASSVYQQEVKQTQVAVRDGDRHDAVRESTCQGGLRDGPRRWSSRSHFKKGPLEVASATRSLRMGGHRGNWIGCSLQKQAWAFRAAPREQMVYHVLMERRIQSAGDQARTMVRV